MNVIRILIADDHPVVRDGLVAMLNTQPDFQVVGEAANGKEVIELADVLRPDVILIDLEMPFLDGVESLRRVRADHPEIQALVLTAFDTDERILGAVQAGAKGYLLKGVAREEIFRAIREIKRGGSLLQPIVTTKLLDHIHASQTEPPLMAGKLTGRETEVLRLLARGKHNKEIAADLQITERTVKFHVSSILKKLHAGNRTEAVMQAVGQGLVDL
jgi:two-component system, NarL family, response regulator LiaR